MNNTAEADQTEVSPFYCTECLCDTDEPSFIRTGDYDEETGEQYIELFCSMRCQRIFETPQ